MRKPLPFRLRVFLATAFSSLIPLLLAVTILHFNFIHSFQEQIASQALDIANLAAGREDVQKSYETLSPAQLLQPIAEDIRTHTRASFVVFLDPQGNRLSHPNEALIGQKFTGGDEGPALKGESYTSKAIGISGPSIRAFKPIYNQEHVQVGAVAVGFFEPVISLILSAIYKTFYFVLPLSLFLIILFSVLLATNLKKTLFGMEPLEIATLLKERDCMLHSVKEGIIAIDDHSKVTVINPAAQNLFPPETEFLGRDISELIPNSQLPLVLQTTQTVPDEHLLINGNIVITNRHPLIINGIPRGAIATFRPLTEVNQIAEELTGVKKIVNALRARTHEFLNKLHVISGLIQLEAYDEAKKYIDNITHKEQSLMSFLLDNIHSSAVVGLLMGKASEAQERQVQFEISPDSQLSFLPPSFDEHAMVVVLGNLIENAFDAVEGLSSRKVKLHLQQDQDQISLNVWDSGHGISSEHLPHLFEAGFTTKEKGQGFGLANLKNRVTVAGGNITIDSHQRSTLFKVTIPCSLS